MQNGKCETCEYFHHAEHRLNGECRKNAPVANGAGCLGVFPFMPPSGWCGEYEGKEPRQKLTPARKT